MSAFASNLMATVTNNLSAIPDSSPAPSPVAAPASTPESTADTPASSAPESPSLPETGTGTDAPAQAPEEFRFSDEPATQAAPADEAAPSDADLNDLGDIAGKNTREVINSLMQTPRGREIYKGYIFRRDISKPVDQGGLGYMPSIEQMREMHFSHGDMEMMRHEFHNGDPTQAANWIRHWFQPGDQGISPGAAKVTETFLPTLDQMGHDPSLSPQQQQQARDMYVRVAMPAINGLVEELYRHAEAQQDPEDRTIYTNVARATEIFLGRKPREITQEFLEKGKPAVDPKATELEAREQRITQWERNQQQVQQQTFKQNFNGAIHTNLLTDSKEALAPLATALSPRMYAAVSNDFLNEVRNRVMANPPRPFLMAQDRARLSGSPQDIKAAADAWRSASRPVIKALRNEYLKENQATIEADSAKRHATAQAASQRNGASSVSQSVGKGASGPVDRLPGESFQERLNRVTLAHVQRAS